MFNNLTLYTGKLCKAGYKKSMFTIDDTYLLMQNMMHEELNDFSEMKRSKMVKYVLRYFNFSYAK